MLIRPRSVFALGAISGFDWDGAPGGTSQRGFVARLGSDGSIAWGRRWRGCDDSSLASVHPTTSIRTSAGNTLVAGLLGSYYRSFVAIVRPDGTIASQSNPTTGSGLSYLAIQSVRELPTSGFLAAGIYTREYDPQTTMLAGLDSAGVMQWARQYTLPPSDPKPAANAAAVQPTDDGGALVAVTTTAPTSGDASLWALKPFAKDGGITFSGGATSTAPAFSNGTCALTDEALAFDVGDLAVAPRSIAVQVVDAALPTASQSP